MTDTPFPAHPQRDRLANELHARPYVPVPVPARITHLAVLSGEEGAMADREHVCKLAGRFNVDGPRAGDRHWQAELGAFTVKWERHTEFSTYTFIRPGRFDEPFAGPVIDGLPEVWLKAIPGEVLAATHLAIEAKDMTERPIEQIARLFGGNTIIGCSVAGGRAKAWSDLRLHDDGFSRILVHDAGLNERQAGRLVQRLLEVNTYRFMALLAFPVAQEAMPRLREIENDLSCIAAGLAASGDAGTDAELLDQLMDVAAEIEEVVAGSSYRMDAARAYFDIVRQRLDELREERIEGLQTFSEFHARRLNPAMNTCEATAVRQETLSQRAARLSALLRARVEVALEAQNKDLLHSMNRRARLQLRLQETVEGLSVAAISYYLVGLVLYAVKGIKGFGVPINTELAGGIAVPVVVLFVWWGLRRTHKALHKAGGED